MCGVKLHETQMLYKPPGWLLECPTANVDSGRADLVIPPEAIHLVQDLHQPLFSLIGSALVIAPGFSNGINLICNNCPSQAQRTCDTATQLAEPGSISIRGQLSSMALTRRARLDCSSPVCQQLTVSLCLWSRSLALEKHTPQSTSFRL